MVAFVAAVLFATVGNAVAHVLPSRRGVAVKFFWSGTPFYLYGLCNRAQPPVPPLLRRLALATNLALIVAFLLAVPLFMFQDVDSTTSNNRWRGP